MTLTISEKLEEFHANNEHAKILQKIKNGELTYRNVINQIYNDMKQEDPWDDATDV